MGYAGEKKRVETNDEVFDGLVMIDGVRFEWGACSQGNQGCLYWMGFGFSDGSSSGLSVTGRMIIHHMLG